MFIRKCLNFDYNAVLKPLDCESFTNIANIKKKDLSSVSFCVVFLFLLQHIAFCIPNKCNILPVVCKPTFIIYSYKQPVKFLFPDYLKHGAIVQPAGPDREADHQGDAG